jgi:hypothetical protein
MFQADGRDRSNDSGRAHDAVATTPRSHPLSHSVQRKSGPLKTHQSLQHNVFDQTSTERVIDEGRIIRQTLANFG